MVLYSPDWTNTGCSTVNLFVTSTDFYLELLLHVLIDFSLTVKSVTLIFISGRSSAIPSAKQGESGSIYNLVKNQ